MAKDIKIPDHPNLALFRDLSRTDPSATKAFNRGRFKGTQIDPTWRILRLTERFGPVGKGWGGEQIAFHVTEDMCFVCARLWYRDPETQEVCWTPPQWGGTVMYDVYADGQRKPNDECLKSAMTDAIGKAALFLGLGADVYLGSFEDSKYREENEAYYQAKADPSVSEPELQKFEARIEEELALIHDLDTLDQLWRNLVHAKLRSIQKVDKARSNRIIALFTQKKYEIQSASREAAE